MVSYLVRPFKSKPQYHNVICMLSLSHLLLPAWRKSCQIYLCQWNNKPCLGMSHGDLTVWISTFSISYVSWLHSLPLIILWKAHQLLIYNLANPSFMMLASACNHYLSFGPVLCYAHAKDSIATHLIFSQNNSPKNLNQNTSSEANSCALCMQNEKPSLASITEHCLRKCMLTVSQFNLMDWGTLIQKNDFYFRISSLLWFVIISSHIICQSLERETPESTEVSRRCHWLPLSLCA